jgi:hypothetical protein
MNRKKVGMMVFFTPDILLRFRCTKRDESSIGANHYLLATRCTRLNNRP